MQEKNRFHRRKIIRRGVSKCPIKQKTRMRGQWGKAIL
jgi:hypothetical protein